LAGFAGAGRLGGAVSRHPREFVGVVMATAAVFAVFTNALFLQKGPHPAPIFVTRPPAKPATPLPPLRPTAQPATAPDPVAQSRPAPVADIQRELGRRGFYDGAADGIWGAKTDAAAREFVQVAGLKISADASPALLNAILASSAKAPGARGSTSEAPRNDPIAELIAPSKRVLAIQRALADFGYGQIPLSGVYDPETRDAIEKFERDRRLPVTGQISDRFVREFAAMTGRPLE
jgi:peptidoglycan hydrolase-like protein with peptidoglycan-binding domain